MSSHSWARLHNFEKNICNPQSILKASIPLIYQLSSINFPNQLLQSIQIDNFLEPTNYLTFLKPSSLGEARREKFSFHLCLFLRKLHWDWYTCFRSIMLILFFKGKCSEFPFSISQLFLRFLFAGVFTQLADGGWDGGRNRRIPRRSRGVGGRLENDGK